MTSQPYSYISESMKLDIFRMMKTAMTEEDAKCILCSKDAITGHTFMEDVMLNMMQSYSYKNDGYCNVTDIRLAFGKVLKQRLGIEGENKMSCKTIVVSAFPCCGKTYAFEHFQNKYSILDSDSSDFSWSYKDGEDKNHYTERTRNPEFPSNYIKHIEENIGKVDIIFVSSHLEVREAMEERGIRYCTVYPNPDMLNEWVGRMYRRGNDDDFIKFQIDHWDEFVKNIDYEPHGFIIWRLGSNQYLDVETLYNFNYMFPLSVI